MDQKGIEVPGYDGTPESLAAYKEAVLQYLMATETHKRYLVGPRLVQRLSGIAKVLIRRPSLIEANKHVMGFFYQLERKRGDTMIEWIDEQANDDSEQRAREWNTHGAGVNRFDEKPFLAGFLLLHRNGLKLSEKSNVLASSKSQFTTQAVARALREQWSDGDVAKRGKAKAATADILEEDDEDAFYTSVDEHEFSQWGPEQQEAYLFKLQKPTLKDSRWRQRQIKLGRNSYPPKTVQGWQGRWSAVEGRHQVFPMRWSSLSGQMSFEAQGEKRTGR